MKYAESSPAPDLNGLALLYRWMEFATFGPLLSRCRCAFIPSLSKCRNAIVLGDGDGRFVARLLRNNDQIHIDAVDASPAMIEALLRRAGADAARLHAYCADARQWLPANSPYDLVVTHFFLDCLTSCEVQSLAEKMRASVSPCALWLISEFSVPDSWFGRIAAQPLVSFLYRAFGLLTGLIVRALPDHRAAMQHCGFQMEEQKTFLGGVLVSEIWSVKSGD